MNYIPLEIKYKDIISSKIYNTERKDIFTDVSQLADDVADVRTRVFMLNDLKEATEFTIQSKLQALTDILIDLNFATTVITLYNPSIVVYPTSIAENTRAKHEILYGRATVNVLETRTLYISKDIKTGADVIHPNALNYINYYTSVESGGSKIDRIIETNIIDALNPFTNDVFLRRYETYENIDYADFVLQLNTINSVDAEFNNIYISPLPESNLTVDYLRYSSSTTTGDYFYHRSASTYLDQKMEHARKTAISFDPIKLNKCELRLKQPYKAGSSPFKYILGLREMLLVNHIYMNVSYIGFKIKVQSSRPRIAAINTNLNAYPDSCEVRLYTNENDFNNITSGYLYRTGDEVSFAEPLDVSGLEYVYMLVKLIPFEGLNSSPELRNILIEWK